MVVTVVTDSTSDLPPELAESLGVHVVPLNVMFGEEEFLDGVTIKPHEFYRRLASQTVFPTTSQPSVGTFLEKYREIGPSSDGILSLHISEPLSGTLNSAIQAKGELGDEGPPVEIVDSRQVGIGLGLVVLAAARAARDGADLSAAANVARETSRKTRIYFLLDTLEYLRRGGRIGAAQAFLGTLLRFHPILAVRDGVIHPLERPRSRRKGIGRLIGLAEALAPASAVAVCTSGEPETARDIAARLEGLAAGGEIVHADIGPVIGAHGGPGLLGIAVVSNQPG